MSLIYLKYGEFYIVSRAYKFFIVNPEFAVGVVNRSETRSWSDFVTQA